MDNGNTFVGWGATGRLSELGAEGNLLWDASVPANFDNYRAYRYRWHGEPAVAPTALAARAADGAAVVHAIWNGATDVDRWVVVGEPKPRALEPLASAEWAGLDTTITVHTDASSVAVIGLGANGRVLGRSASTPVSNPPAV